MFETLNPYFHQMVSFPKEAKVFVQENSPSLKQILPSVLVSAVWWGAFGGIPGILLGATMGATAKVVDSLVVEPLLRRRVSNMAIGDAAKDQEVSLQRGVSNSILITNLLITTVLAICGQRTHIFAFTRLSWVANFFGAMYVSRIATDTISRYYPNAGNVFACPVV